MSEQPNLPMTVEEMRIMAAAWARNDAKHARINGDVWIYQRALWYIHFIKTGKYLGAPE